VPRSQFSPRHDRLRAALVKARHAQGLTQAQVASRLRRPQSFVSKFEGGDRRLDVVEFIEVTKALRADPCAILKEVD
jgi:transcriptional regulator with XRE-family HTH domain